MRRLLLLAAAAALFTTANPSPAHAGWANAAVFNGVVNYSSALTNTTITSRTATLITDSCVHQGVPTPFKTAAIPLLPGCSLTLTFPLNVGGLVCFPVGATTASGTFTGMGGNWNLNGVVVPTAVFGGVALVVDGWATTGFFPFQSGPFTAEVVLTPNPVGGCTTNVTRSSAFGNFTMAAIP